MCEEALTADLNTPAGGVTPGVVGAAPTPMFGAFGGGVRAVDTNGDGIADSLITPIPGVYPTATPTAVPQPLSQQPQMTVRVPRGVVAGQMVAITVNGAPMQVQIPVGLSEGQVFAINPPSPFVTVDAVPLP